MSLSIFVCGPDGVGKTTLVSKMSRDLSVPSFKVQSEKKNWVDGTFKFSLKFDALLPQFVKQTETSFISDRGYACEFAYAKAFGRETDFGLLKSIDDEWASMSATHVLCFLKDYSKARPDDLVKQDQLKRIEDAYLEFADWTSTSVIGLYFDEFLKWEQWRNDNRGEHIIDYDLVAKEVYAGFEAYKIKTKYPRVYELIRKGEI